MDIAIDQQVALDDALFLYASRLRIGKSNFRLRSDLKSKELTLQVVYDVLKLTPFYKAFLVTTDVPKIYMQEFWATATVHHHSIRFKMNNKQHIVNLDGEIKMITYVNINKLHQPWRSFAVVINKCLSGKSIEHKDAKKSNKMYYPRFTKVIVNFFMTKYQSISRGNKVNWHFARDDHMFTMIKLVSRHQNTQQYDAILPIELTNEAIRNSESYKEYYAIASGAEPPKTKASVEKKQSSSDTTMPPPTAKGKRLKTSAKVDKQVKEKQPAKTSKAKGLTVLSEVALTESEHMNEEDDDEEVNMSEHDEDVDDQSDDDDQNDDDDGDQDFSTHDDEDKEEESFDPIVQSPSHDENTDNEDNDEDSHGMNVEGDEMDDEGENEEDDANELYRDVNINIQGQDVQMVDVQTTQVIEDTHVTLTPVNLEGQQQSSFVSSRFVSNMLNPSPDTGFDSIFNLNIESTPRVDVLVTTTTEPPLVSATTLPPSSTPIIPTLQQTPLTSKCSNLLSARSS
nr:hypothetical protein [Tanacetum cinerariifolium]